MFNRCQPVPVPSLRWQLFCERRAKALAVVGPLTTPLAVRVQLETLKSRQLVASSAGRPVAWGLWHLEQVKSWARAVVPLVPMEAACVSVVLPLYQVAYWAPRVVLPSVPPYQPVLRGGELAAVLAASLKVVR